MTIAVDIDVDWNEEDDTGLGLPWTFVDRAADPARIQAGEFVVAGRGTAIAVAEVVDVDETGVVHLRPLPGSVAENRHRVGHRRPA